MLFPFEHHISSVTGREGGSVMTRATAPGNTFVGGGGGGDEGGHTNIMLP